MSVNYYLLSILFFITISTKAQTTEKARIRVKYRFIHVRDTTDRQRPYTEDLVLLIGQSSSAYLSEDEQRQIELRNKELKEQISKSTNPNSLDLVITGTRPVSSAEYFQFLSIRKLFIREKLNNDYLTEEPLPLINWKISNDKMMINGFQCQKATAHFRGRDYIAWFCADFPIQVGPWKLNGLPGLIMQAEDVKKEVVFQFKGLEDITDKDLLIKIPGGWVKATRKDVDRLLELQRKDPAAYAKLPAGKVSGVLGDVNPSRVNSIRVNSPVVNFGKKINNPIELPEKK
ncbi:GLPGLI family protein [Desertivirga xinjiangensis]|uniref:GLPGLI family protein n=1 Tax=Desertivirga xinjiangensis TaxID=539206 RepID=UPI002109BBC9|nr:GLPGLI family protein [Pedobacter xinjiangensis]